MVQLHRPRRDGPGYTIEKLALTMRLSRCPWRGTNPMTRGRSSTETSRSVSESCLGRSGGEPINELPLSWNDYPIDSFSRASRNRNVVAIRRSERMHLVWDVVFRGHGHYR